MNPYHRIVVATDLSAFSETALAAAVQLARRDDAQLHVLHVRSAVQGVVSTTLGIGDPTSEVLGDRSLRAWIRASGFDEDVSVMRVISGGGDPATQILRYTREEHADLIVMGQHSHHEVTVPFLGSEAHRVLREAECHVLISHGLGETPSIKRILAPVDLSEHSAEALCYAGDMAARLGAGLTVYMALEPLALPPYLPLKDMEKDNAVHAEAALKRFVADADLPVQHQVVVERGTPHRCITEYARDQKIDLIVMGRAGLGRIERLFIGSVTERVLRTAPCAVLVHHDQGMYAGRSTAGMLTASASVG